MALESDPAWDVAPNAMAWMCYTSWDGLHPRSPASLSIRPIPTGFAVTVRLDSEAQVGTYEVSSFGGILERLEEIIRNRVRIWKELERGKGAQKLREERKKIEDARNAKD